ncbi:MAG: (2Fe-2S)-binding protein [Clostridium sp.]|uniref:(2Fe-2S)-binding protein n=1 Tax=Clostridium sp. TaxID=1506 RepID=UPI00303E9DFF
MIEININININGVDYRREVNPMMRLIDFLRDEMKLKGTKEGCGEGECGACTVILNGNTVNSCLILVGTIDDGEILTIEGVGKNGINPIQEAFMEVGASQCGYCTPGMVLSAKSLLDKNIDSTEAEIREGISGNLCRCTGYEKIVQGVILAQKKLK